MFKKNSNIVISLGDDGAIVSYFNSGRLVKRIFVTSPLSTDFIDLTKSVPEASIYLLLDTIDQNYIFSNIPQVGKSNIKKIIKRKIANEFDPADLNAYLFLGKDQTSTKRNLRYLFVSVRNSSPFKDWVEAITALSNEFEGVYLLPIESEDFVKKLRLATHGETKQTPDEWEVFISYNRVGGFRQIVLKHGKLIFTRISQSVSLQTPDAVGRNISQEAANTLEYIRRIGFYDQTISMYVICAKDAANYIEVPGIKQKDIFIYNPYDLAQKLDIAHSAQEGDKFGDVIFAANFVSCKKKILRLSTREIKTETKLRAALNLVNMTGIILMAALPVLTIYFFYTAIVTSLKISDQTKVMQAKNRELVEVKNFEKEYGVKPENLIDAVRANREFSSRDEAFFTMLKEYKEADKFSNYIQSIVFSDNVKGNRTLDLTVVFDYSNEKDYSNVLYQIEQYTTSVKNALEDYRIEFSGLPSEKDIKVDFTEKDKKMEKTVVKVKITAGK